MEEAKQLTLDDAEILLSVAQVARKLAVSEGTITVWIKAGDFPNAFKLNPRFKQSRWVIPKSDLDAYIAKQRATRGWCYVNPNVN